MGDAAREAAYGVEALGVHQRLLQPPLLGLVAVRRDNVGEPALAVEQRIVAPRGADGGTVAAGEQALPGEGLAGLGLAEPAFQPGDIGGVDVQQAVGAPDELEGGAPGHRAKTVVRENDLEAARAAGPRADEHALALRAQRRSQQGRRHGFGGRALRT